MDVEVVILDWDALGQRDALAPRLARLLGAGTDLVVVSAAPIDHLDRVLASAAGEPGRLSLITKADCGGDPAAWAADHLLGAGAPDHAVRTVDDEGDLDRLVAAAEGFPTETPDPAWTLAVDGFDPRRERDVESWLSVGNGRAGTRGSLEEGSDVSSPAFYVAGLFGHVDGDPLGPCLVEGPEWTRLHPRAGGADVRMDPATPPRHRRVLDMREGLLLREWHQRLASGDGWSFRSARFASLADRQVLALEAEAACDGAPVSLAGPIPAEHRANLEILDVVEDGDRTFVTLKGHAGRQGHIAIGTDERDGRLERLVTVVRDGEGGGRPDAGEALTAAQVQRLGRLRARHRLAWRARWADADVVVTGDARAQQALRFSLYHLISSGDIDSDLASIGARDMTGPGYRGHVFWDTDVFVLPFFVWTDPPTARALLAYRHRTLAGARRKAAAMGYQGALFAWESTDTGDDVTPEHFDLPNGTRLEVLTGIQEHHISADVAWAAWQYWQVTGDIDFLVTMGAEIVLETARFWASRVRKDGGGRFHIDGVIGPDEYHEGVDDNAYTNVMARWNLRTAVQVCALLPTLDPLSWEALVERIGLDEATETPAWEAVAAGLVDGFDAGTNLYEQFAGFFGLDDVRAADLARRPFTGEIVLGLDRLRRSRLVKQADVVMLAHLLPGEIGGEVARANYDYYEPRTCHGSSLSPAIHAAVAARLGAMDDALRYFEAAASIDLADGMGNAATGVHVATMGGLWQAAVMGFGGVAVDGDTLRIDPHVPSSWTSLAFPLRWRGTRLRVGTDGHRLHVDSDGTASVAVGDDPPVRLEPGRYVATREAGRWTALRLTDGR